MKLLVIDEKSVYVSHYIDFQTFFCRKNISYNKIEGSKDKDLHYLLKY